MAFVARALDSPISFIIVFLRYARSALPEVWEALCAALADNDRRAAFGARALDAPLDGLGDFLRYTQSALPEIWAPICDILTLELHRKVLVERVLKSPAGNVSSFLRYTAEVKELRALRSDITDLFSNETYRKSVVGWLEDAGPERAGVMSGRTIISRSYQKDRHRQLAASVGFSGFRRTELDYWVCATLL